MKIKRITSGFYSAMERRLGGALAFDCAELIENGNDLVSEALWAFFKDVRLGAMSPMSYLDDTVKSQMSCYFD